MNQVKDHRAREFFFTEYQLSCQVSENVPLGIGLSIGRGRIDNCSCICKKLKKKDSKRKNKKEAYGIDSLDIDK